MAFLDNSGDIILDAVLTDLGREKMATGDFSVSYFALGDDEIDYALYDKNHPSGSAYYDLEILQTPVLEAFTGTNAAINGGLLTSTATNILYMPVLKGNDKGVDSNVISPSTDTTGGGSIYWLTDSSNDSLSATAIATVLETNSPEVKFLNGDTTTKFVLIEDGLNTTTYKGTAANTLSLLSSNGLINSNYYIHYDNRFIATVYGATEPSSFSNTVSSGGTVSVSMTAGRASSFDLSLANYSTTRISGFPDEVYYSPTMTVSDTTVSAITGPRGNFTALALAAQTDLGDKYSLFGSSKTINGSSCEYIDTTVYIEGATTGATLQLPVRIVRLKV